VPSWLEGAGDCWAASGDAENLTATASAALQTPVDLHLDLRLENGLEVPASSW